MTKEKFAIHQEHHTVHPTPLWVHVGSLEEKGKGNLGKVLKKKNGGNFHVI